MHTVFLGRLAPTPVSAFFFFNDTATTEIYTLSLHDALPIFIPCVLPRKGRCRGDSGRRRRCPRARQAANTCRSLDRKSTRLNSSHLVISYAVFCLKKKNRTLQSFRALGHMVGAITALRTDLI